MRFRDLEPIWEVLIQILFYASPIIYVATTVPDSVQRWAAMNPISTILTQMRHALIDSNAPTAATMVGGWAWLSVPVAISAGLFVLGLWVFARETPRIAENL